MSVILSTPTLKATERKNLWSNRKHRPSCQAKLSLNETTHLNERHSDGAHLDQLVHSLVSMIYRLGQKLCEVTIVEYPQGAIRRNLAHCGGMEIVGVIASPRLNENGGVGETLGVDFAIDIAENDSLADVPSSVLDGGVPIDIREQAQAEPWGIFRRIREAVYSDRIVLSRCSEHFANTRVQLVVSNLAPVLRFLVIDRMHLWSW